MSATDVGRAVEYQYADGEFAPGWVVEYKAGRPEGDHRVGGFTVSGQKKAGGGDVYNVWSVVGHTQGSFRFA